jgi:hypothetical protein
MRKRADRRPLLRQTVLGFFSWCVAPSSSWCGAGAAGWGQVREWLVRRAGVRGASRPRWRQSRSPVAPRTACRGAGGVGLQVPADAAADLAFQCSQFLFRCLALGDFLVVAGAAIAGPVADLGDRGHVDGVVQAPVPAQREPAGRAAAGRYPDRGGAVTGREPVPVREPVTSRTSPITVAGDDRADAEDLGESATARPGTLSSRGISKGSLAFAPPGHSPRL